MSRDVYVSGRDSRRSHKIDDTGCEEKQPSGFSST